MRADRLLETPLIIRPGMSDEEIDDEFQRMLVRTEITSQFLAGQIDVETYFDFMIQDGYEPAELMESAEENLDATEKAGVLIE